MSKIKMLALIWANKCVGRDSPSLKRYYLSQSLTGTYSIKTPDRRGNCGSRPGLSHPYYSSDSSLFLK